MLCVLCYNVYAKNEAEDADDPVALGRQGNALVKAGYNAGVIHLLNRAVQMGAPMRRPYSDCTT